MTVGEHDESVTIIQDERRFTVQASVHADTVTGSGAGWTITYRVPDGEAMALDEARPVTVVWPEGCEGRFLAWKKIGRRRLGVGVGPLPRT